MIKTIVFCALSMGSAKAQPNAGMDSIPQPKVVRLANEMRYNVGSGKVLVYPKPRNFGFVLNLPQDAVAIAKAPFKKESVKPLLIVAGTTGLLLLTDQGIIDGVTTLADRNNIERDEDYKNLMNFKLGGKDVSLMRFPKNINTAFYQLGQGFPSLMIGLGLYSYGKIKNDYRSLSTASQLAEAFILMGVSTQIVKRVTGRQSPSESMVAGGKWKLFPSFSEYQNHTPNYDAFPSGHLATLMSTITILTENYPEKRWIKPVGYTFTGLVGLAMINNKVHWASDYPLALAMGYLCAKQVAKRNRQLLNTTAAKKHRGELDYTFNYFNGSFMPGVVYKF